MAKTKSERAAEREAEQARRRVVDDYARLDQALAPIRGDIKRHSYLGSLIRSWFAEVDQDKNVRVLGDEFAVTLGPIGFETRVVDLPAVYKLLGKEEFLRQASISLNTLKEAGLDETAIASVSETSRTGYRKFINVCERD